MTLSYQNMVDAVQRARNGSLKDLGDVLKALVSGDDPYVGGVQVTATAAEINAAADVSGRLVSIETESRAGVGIDGSTVMAPSIWSARYTCWTASRTAVAVA